MNRQTYERQQGRERYQRYLQTPHWRRIRLRVFERADWRCEGEITEEPDASSPWGRSTRCETITGLQVHHLSYDRLGHERLEDLVCLCAACHKFEHLNACALCEEPIFASRADLEDLLEERSLARDALDALEDMLSWHETWPYCHACAHMLEKD